MCSHEDRLKRIYKHFANIDLEEFEENMLSCGYGDPKYKRDKEKFTLKSPEQ